MAHIMPGSLEVEDGYITAGVHNGPSEWQPKDLRYIKIQIPENPAAGQTVDDLMTWGYENSEGCLINGGFRMTA